MSSLERFHHVVNRLRKVIDKSTNFYESLRQAKIELVVKRELA